MVSIIYDLACNRITDYFKRKALLLIQKNSKKRGRPKADLFISITYFLQHHYSVKELTQEYLAPR